MKKKRKKKAISIFLSLLALSFLIFAFSLILKMPFLQISKAEVKGAITLDSGEISATALEALKGKSLFYSEKSVKEELMEKFKKIKTLEIRHSNINALSLNISERQPFALICEGFREEDDSNICYFADDEAVMYEKASHFSDGIYPKYYVNQDTLEKEEFIDLQNFISVIKNAGIVTTGILVGENGAYELYIKNNDDTGAVIYFDNKKPFPETASNLIAFLAKTKEKNFDYINLRFGNNIFYTIR
ncbi:MAG TPA: hypothetical protein VJI66_02565 [Candidatus Paceibacterota bacterium]